MPGAGAWQHPDLLPASARLGFPSGAMAVAGLDQHLRVGDLHAFGPLSTPVVSGSQTLPGESAGQPWVIKLRPDLLPIHQARCRPNLDEYCEFWGSVCGPDRGDSRAGASAKWCCRPVPPQSSVHDRPSFTNHRTAGRCRSAMTAVGRRYADRGRKSSHRPVKRASGNRHRRKPRCRKGSLAESDEHGHRPPSSRWCSGSPARRWNAGNRRTLRTRPVLSCRSMHRGHASRPGARRSSRIPAPAAGQ